MKKKKKKKKKKKFQMTLLWPYGQLVYAQTNIYRGERQINSYGTLTYKHITHSRPEDQTF